MDLTKRIQILNTLPKIKRWKSKKCVHAKQIDPQAGEFMYCEHCNKDGHQMWMIYDYDNKTWKGSSHFFLCGTPLHQVLQDNNLLYNSP